MKNEEQLYPTNNRPLAFALACAGVELAPQECMGPCQNLYTLQFLRDKKIGKGLPIEKAVELAFDKKIPGITTYVFLRSETLNRVIAAWDAMSEEHQLAKSENREAVLPDVSPEHIAATHFMAAVNDANFAELPFFNLPLCSDMAGKTTSVPLAGKPAPKTITKGSGQIWQMGKARRGAIK